MFAWYAGAKICYTYLSDFDALDPIADISQSKWFTRGWTLQELIAPAQVNFYDKSWCSTGTRDVLSPQLSLITGIETEVLLASEHRNVEELLKQLPLARRMSWAAKRETTRAEDLAYCLLGIFGVNLPLLYGEGERAFVRLQEEIVKNSNDLSLLAWRLSRGGTPIDHDHGCGVFAQHPRYFEASDKLTLINDVKFMPDFSMTNKGLKIYTRLHFDHLEGLHVLVINCNDASSSKETLGIYLRHQGASVYARARPAVFALDQYRIIPEIKSIFLSKSILPSVAKLLHGVQYYPFFTPIQDSHYFQFVAAKPETLWDRANTVFITAGLQDFVGCHVYHGPRDFKVATASKWQSETYDGRILVVFGFGYGFAPWARIVPLDDNWSSAIESGSWEYVAWKANKADSEHVEICFDRSQAVVTGARLRRLCFHVECSQGVQGEELVYTIQIKTNSCQRAQ